MRTEPFDDLDRVSPADLVGWVGRRGGEVLTAAAAEIPFYREHFAGAGFDPASFTGVADLARVPLTRKADILALQRRGDPGVERLGTTPGRIMTMSSGTLGTTFLTWPKEWREIQGRSSLRAHWWAGVRPGTPFLLVAPGWHVYAAVQSYIVGQLDLPGVVVAGTYLPRFADRIVDALLRFRPRFLILFLPMVFSLLAEARRQGLRPADLYGSVEHLVVTGAPITPGMRDHLTRLTGVGRVVELAGSSENLLAVECGAGAGLHVVPDTCWVEVLAEPGGRGPVVHTTMVPWGSVYIRYDGGDIGVLDPAPCPCGLPSPRMKILGRAEHAFRLAGASWLPYDVQVTVEEATPELAGVGFAILAEGLAAGRLDLLFQGPRAAGAGQAVEKALTARFGAAAEVRWSENLPLLLKGVTPILSERDLP